MAIFNEVADKGQLNQVMQRRLNMTGAAPAPSLMPEIGPVLVLENDRPEWGFLKGEFAWSQRLRAAAPGAGNHAMYYLENPANSGVLAVVSLVYCSVLARIVATGTLPASTLLSSLGGRPRDTRQPGLSRVRAADATIPTANIPATGYELAGGTQLREPFVIAPGGWMLVISDVAATAMTTSSSWTERPAMPGELG